MGNIKLFENKQAAGLAQARYLQGRKSEKEKLELLRNNPSVKVDAFLGYPNFYKVK